MATPHSHANMPLGAAKMPAMDGASPPRVQVTMDRAFVPETADQALWIVIRNSAEALSFEKYADFIEPIMGGHHPHRARNTFDNVNKQVKLTFPDAEPYRLLKVATEVFMMANTGVVIGEHDEERGTSFADADFKRLGRQPLSAEEELRLLTTPDAADITDEWRRGYLRHLTNVNNMPIETIPYLYDIVALKLGDVPILAKDAYGARTCYGILQRKLTRPCLLELIWNYWHEEGMLVQTMNAITWRFQNRRGAGDRDPLTLLEIDPLRPLNNFIWGWVQDEQHRLTVARRAYEYDHHYGLNLLGKAVPPVRGADSRSRFLEAFHNLLFRCSIFFKEDDDTTVVADGFPILNALKEVHLLLTQGAHNQYGDLPWTARQEMLMQEWMLARPEMREFLPSRIMIDYPEPWMDRVETMKTLQGWTDTSILHFRDLGIFGEQVLLGIRFGAWPSVIEPQNAANWARYWRPEIQGYIHAYRAVTGVDLTERVDATLPSMLLQQRLGPQRAMAAPQVVLTPMPSRLGQLPPRSTR